MRSRALEVSHTFSWTVNSEWKSVVPTATCSNVQWVCYLFCTNRAGLRGFWLLQDFRNDGRVGSTASKSSLESTIGLSPFRSSGRVPPFDHNAATSTIITAHHRGEVPW
jgi:hypothetical protein